MRPGGVRERLLRKNLDRLSLVHHPLLFLPEGFAQFTLQNLACSTHRQRFLSHFDSARTLVVGNARLAVSKESFVRNHLSIFGDNNRVDCLTDGFGSGLRLVPVSLLRIKLGDHNVGAAHHGHGQVRDAIGQVEHRCRMEVSPTLPSVSESRPQHH